MRAAHRALLPSLVLLAFTGAMAGAQAPSLGGLATNGNGQSISIESEQGVEWQQANHVYIARGHVKTTRGNDTLYCDTLYAYYRPATTQTQPVSAKPAADRSKTGQAAPFANGSTEIYRIEADGNVRITTPTQTTYGDHAVYDVDRSIMVLTGKNLRLVTPRDTVTARDSLEWYDKQQVGVARGDAIATRDSKRVRGDVLTAILEKPANQPAHISRIDASGNVVITSLDQIARGDAGVYNVDTGIATLSGHVSLTRGQNELRGQYAVVDLNRNVGRILPAPPNTRLTGKPPRVEGLIVPQPQQARPAPARP